MHKQRTTGPQERKARPYKLQVFNKSTDGINQQITEWM
jgi:hypothetical protein